jgi:putative endonuclease
MGPVTSTVAGRAGGYARKALGNAGEGLAVAWYEARGYEVLARNWSCREGELDIVLRLGRAYVFCEVKARTSSAFGLPAEAVGLRKQARVRRLAALWFVELSRGGGGGGAAAGQGSRAGGPVRFDVASVLGGEVTVIEGAF